MDIDEKVNALYRIRKLDKEEDVPIFENIIQEIFTDPKPEYVIFRKLKKKMRKCLENVFPGF